MKENIDIGRYVAKKLGFTFAEMNSRLFVEASSAFQAAGFSTTIDRSDATNPVLVVKKDDSQARLPISKNLVLVHGKSIDLERNQLEVIRNPL